jgi:hypothetical protein
MFIAKCKAENSDSFFSPEKVKEFQRNTGDKKITSGR